MDLLDLKPKTDFTVVELKNPSTGEAISNADGTPMSISLWLKHSKAYKQVAYKFQDARIAEMESGESTKMSAEKLDQGRTTLLADIVKEWNITYSGKTPDVSEAYSIFDENTWIRDQVEEGLEKAAVFTKA